MSKLDFENNNIFMFFFLSFFLFNVFHTTYTTRLRGGHTLFADNDCKMSSITIDVVNRSDVPELVPLMRIYCDTSDEPHVAKPSTTDLFALCHKILDDPEREGIYLIARDNRNSMRTAVGFASLFWSWSLKFHAGRRAILGDLFVHMNARGLGIAGLLLQACQDQARQRQNIRSIIWQTSMENLSAQKVYQRFDVTPSRCADYELVLLHDKSLI
jgi:GNAT superfamily N-acetyltransferase